MSSNIDFKHFYGEYIGISPMAAFVGASGPKHLHYSNNNGSSSDVSLKIKKESIEIFYSNGDYYCSLSSLLIFSVSEDCLVIKGSNKNDAKKLIIKLSSYKGLKNCLTVFYENDSSMPLGLFLKEDCFYDLLNNLYEPLVWHKDMEENLFRLGADQMNAIVSDDISAFNVLMEIPDYMLKLVEKICQNLPKGTSKTISEKHWVLKTILYQGNDDSIITVLNTMIVNEKSYHSVDMVVEFLKHAKESKSEIIINKAIQLAVSLISEIDSYLFGMRMDEKENDLETLVKVLNSQIWIERHKENLKKSIFYLYLDYVWKNKNISDLAFKARNLFLIDIIKTIRRESDSEYEQIHEGINDTTKEGEGILFRKHVLYFSSKIEIIELIKEFNSPDVFISFISTNEHDDHENCLRIIREKLLFNTKKEKYIKNIFKNCSEKVKKYLNL